MQTAISSTDDESLSIVRQPLGMEQSVEEPFAFLDNRTWVQEGATVSGSLLTCEARQEATVSTPTVQWTRNGKTVIEDTNHIFSNSNRTVEIINFSSFDAGVYQCIFIDGDDEAEVITTIPFRLDTGNICFKICK